MGRGQTKAAPHQVLRAASVQGASGRMRERATKDSWKCACNAINIGTIQCQNCGLLHNARTGELVEPPKQRKHWSRSYLVFAVIAILGSAAIAVAAARMAPVTSREREISPNSAPPQLVVTP